MNATDELRELAGRMDGLVLDTPDMLREAADAIDVLREENERFIIKLNAEHIVRQNVESKNADLRELVRDIWDAYRCEEVAPNVAKHWHDRMRELGIEVD